MKINYKILLDEDIVWDCLVWYFAIDKIKKTITIIFDVPHYRLDAYLRGGKDLPNRDFRLVVFENIENLKLNFKRLFSKPGTYENFLFWIKEKPVEIEYMEILKSCKKIKMKIDFGQYGKILFEFDETIIHLKRSLKAIHKVDGDQMYLVTESGDIVSLKELTQTKDFVQVFFD